LAQSKAKGLRQRPGQYQSKRSGADLLPDLEALGIDKRRADRWRKAAKLSEDEFAALVALIWDVEADDDLGAVGSLAHLSSNKDEWATPQDLWDRLDQEYHFDLDVCASASNAKCKDYFTKDDDALSKDWSGVCWMNPPYSAIPDFLEKARASAEAGATVVCLVPSRTDVGWFWDIARQGDIRFIRGRLWHVDDKGRTGPAPFPSCLIVFGQGAGLGWHDY
jgi:phage N-6-adenine-methyltransferase